MRVCYLVQSHRDPRQVARLVETLGRQSAGSLVLVVHDESASALDPATLAGPAETHYLAARGPIRRGRLSMLAPWLQGVRWLRDAGLDYAWLVYLSGQDYPTRPLADSEAELAAAGCDGFLRWWPAFALGGPWRPHQGHRRYAFRYAEAPAWALPALRLARLLNGLQSRVHVHLTYGPRVGVRLRRTPFENGRVCYGGWQWTTLRRACAEHVLEVVERDRALVEHYRRTVCPDESLVQTILVNEGRFALVDDNLRYAETGGREGRARLLGVADFQRLTERPYHFARKFDLDHDPRILDLLDEWNEVSTPEPASLPSAPSPPPLRAPSRVRRPPGLR